LILRLVRIRLQRVEIRLTRSFLNISISKMMIKLKN
jgi:hypothetical protein